MNERPLPDSDLPVDDPWPKRVGLILLGMLAGLAIAECLLVLAGLPRSYAPRVTGKQFYAVGAQTYVNQRLTRIRFTYADNPRGYFGAENEVDHQTNSLGFRARHEFDLDGHDHASLRIAFFGDSFTFGEGVKDEHTFANRTADLLSSAWAETNPRQVESYNFGVGGYNTSQSRNVLRQFGLRAQPDLVVLGYVINDAEPSLLEVGEYSRRPSRRKRQAEEIAQDAEVPDTPIFKLRTTSLLWSGIAGARQTRRTIDYYRSLYEPESPGWLESKDALEEFIKLCGDREIPCVVVLLPILLQTSHQYPFQEIHKSVRSCAEAAGAYVVSPLPRLFDLSDEETWVHPTDHHPNEIVHEIFAQEVVSLILSTGILETPQADQVNRTSETAWISCRPDVTAETGSQLPSTLKPI